MSYSLYNLARRIRHSSFLGRQRWFFDLVSPPAQAVLRRLMRRGFPTEVEGDTFLLTHEFRHCSAGNDREFYRLWVTNLREGMTALDIGAHVGVFTLAAARRAGPTGRVFGFEPSQETAAVLEEHVRLNGFTDRVTVVRAAVCDRVGAAEFHAAGLNQANSLERGSVAKFSGGQAIERVTVPGTTVDHFCREHRVFPDAIKIDAEGAEMQILRGAQDTLRSQKPFLLCEVHLEELGFFGDSTEDLERLMDGLGYRCERIGGVDNFGRARILFLPRTPGTGTCRPASESIPHPGRVER